MIGGVCGQPTRRFFVGGAGAMDEVLPAKLTLLPWCTRVLEPLGQQPEKHHRKLLKELQKLAGTAKLDRLIVLMPPGSAKSTYASLLFPAWWFMRHPRSAVIAASHTAELAAHFGRALRNLVAE
jgi:hypothetical protein